MGRRVRSVVSRAKGRIERPSAGVSAVAPAASSSVGARSMFATSSSETVPGGMPGPRISSGTCEAGS